MSLWIFIFGVYWMVMFFIIRWIFRRGQTDDHGVQLCIAILSWFAGIGLTILIEVSGFSPAKELFGQFWLSVALAAATCFLAYRTS